MDFGATISRAVNIVLRHRVLWVLGFLAALAGGGASVNNFNFSGGQFGRPGPGGAPGVVDPQLQRFLDLLQRNSGAILAGALGLICVFVLIGIVLGVIGIIAEGGLIGGVDQIERDGNTTFGQAWGAGMRRFGPLFILHLLVTLPILVVLLIGAVMIGGSLATVLSAAVSGRADNTATAGLAGAGVAALCIGGALACFLFIYGILTAPILTFGERAIVLDGKDVGDSIRQAWAVFQANLVNILLLAIVLVVINSIVGLVVALVSAALFVPVVAAGILSGVNASGQFSLSPGTVVLAALAFLVVTVIAAIIRALIRAFSSTTWTLAYRQFTGKGLAADSTGAPSAPLPTA